MEINEHNIKETIYALRQCAKEHKNDITDTCSIRVSDLCDDVANFLEKLQDNGWHKIEDNDYPEDGEFILASYKSLLTGMRHYEPIYYPEPPLTDEMDFWLRLPENETII